MQKHQIGEWDPRLTQFHPPQAMFYAVTPMSWCPHLVAVSPIPASGLDVTQKCQDCGTPKENWVCLSCYKVWSKGREWGGGWSRSKLQQVLTRLTLTPISGLLQSLHQCSYGPTP